MNITTMRQVDKWVGAPVCAALTGARKCGDLRRAISSRRPTDVRRILFVKLAEQGATVLAYPAIQRAVEMVGPENTFFLVFEENRFILDALGVIPRENVVTIPSRHLLSTSWGATRALWKIRRLRCDAAVDFEFFARSSAALTYLSGAKVRVGMHGFQDGAPYRGDLMTHRVRYNRGTHTTHAFASMVESIARPSSELPDRAPLPDSVESAPEYQPTEKELEAVRCVVEREANTADYRPLVLLNANASDMLPLRRWPAERYVELARQLLAESPQTRVAFTGAPHEAAVAEQLVAEVGSERCFSMAGKTSLRELLSLYCLADLLVTNDSGPAHFATLTPIHVITLFGPETPALFGALTARNHSIWKDLPCSPCVNALNNRHSTCTDNQCMKQITVDEVFSAACRILRERQMAVS